MSKRTKTEYTVTFCTKGIERVGDFTFESKIERLAETHKGEFIGSGFGFGVSDYDFSFPTEEKAKAFALSLRRRAKAQRIDNISVTIRLC